jgi:hypothetical protein
MLYRSSILRKESEIRQVPGMVGAVVDPLLSIRYEPKELSKLNVFRHKNWPSKRILQNF